MTKKQKIFGGVGLVVVVLAAGLAIFTNLNTGLFRGATLPGSGSYGSITATITPSATDNTYVIDYRTSYVDGVSATAVRVNGVLNTDNGLNIEVAATPRYPDDQTVVSCKLTSSRNGVDYYAVQPIGSITPKLLTKQGDRFVTKLNYADLPAGSYLVYVNCEHSDGGLIPTYTHAQRTISLDVTKVSTGSGSAGPFPTAKCDKFDTITRQQVQDALEFAYEKYAETGFTEYIGFGSGFGVLALQYTHFYESAPNTDWYTPTDDTLITVLNRYVTAFNNFIYDENCEEVTFSSYRIGPTIASFTPTSGSVGTTVTINGTGFDQFKNTIGSDPETVIVKFVNKQTSGTVQSDSRITTVVPEGAQTGRIEIQRVGGGVSPITTTSSFTVTSSSSTPSHNTVRIIRPSNSTTVNGTVTIELAEEGSSTSDSTSCVNGLTYKIDNGAKAALKYSGPFTWQWNTTTVSDGNHTITAYCSADGNPELDTDTVTVNVRNTATTPTIASFNPISGPVGTTVAITGTNFNSLKGPSGSSAPNQVIVSFGSNEADRPSGIATTTSVTDTQLVVNVPVGAITGPIYIKKPSTSASTYIGSSQTFTVEDDRTVDTAAPVISNTQPTGTVTSSSTTLSVTTNEPATCQYSTASAGADAFPMIPSGNTSSASLTGLTDGVKNYYVRCTDSAGNPSDIATVTFTVNLSGGTIPTLLTPSDTATNVSRTPRFTWQPAAGATSYSLFVSTTEAGLESATPVTLTTTSYTPTTQLAASTRYYWTVAAVNAGGSSVYTPFSFTTAAATTTDTTPPTIVLVKPLSTTTLPAGTTTTAIEVTTNENAFCDYHTSSTFAVGGDGNTWLFPDTAGTKHTGTIRNLAAGTNTGYVRCKDVAGNTSAATTVTTKVAATTNLVNVTADDLVERGADADVEIKLGDADYIAVIANIVGPNGYAKTVYYYCHNSYAENCPTKKTTKLEGPTTIDATWDTTGVAPGKYEVRVSARVTNSEVYRDDDEEIEVLVGSAGNCEDYFDDMKSNSPLCREVSFLRDRGIFMGQEVNGKRVANLNGNLIRSEYFAVATRLYGRTGSSVNYNDLLRFRDMSPAVISNPSNSWWVEAVLQLDGIVKGYGDGTLRPTQNITMAELGKVTSLATGFVRFYDDTRSPWYADIMNAYANVGVNFNPESRARRGDAVKLIYDTIQTVEGNYR